MASLADLYERVLHLEDPLPRILRRVQFLMDEGAKMTKVNSLSDLFRSYEQLCNKTAKYPDAGSGNILELFYLTAGLIGETGEVAEKIKKLYRDCDVNNVNDIPLDRLHQLSKEIGDAFWYLSRLCFILNLDPDAVIRDNMSKLTDRLQRDVLQGDGDAR